MLALFHGSCFSVFSEKIRNSEKITLITISHFNSIGHHKFTSSVRISFITFYLVALRIKLFYMYTLLHTKCLFTAEGPVYSLFTYSVLFFLPPPCFFWKSFSRFLRMVSSSISPAALLPFVAITGAGAGAGWAGLAGVSES